MSRLMCSLSALVLLAGPAAAQSVKMLIVKPGFVDNEFIYGRGKLDRTTPIVIPQTNVAQVGQWQWGWDNPTNAVAGVHGLGRTTSIINFAAAQAACEAAGACITTEGYAGGTNLFTAEVSDCTIRGPHDLGEFPYGNPNSDPSLGACVRLRAVNAIVENVHLLNWQGTGVLIGSSAGFGESRISKSTIVGCQTGIEGTSDIKISDNVVVGHRDNCLFVGPFAGSVQSSGNHYFAAQRAIYTNGGSLNSTNDVASDCNYGVLLTPHPQFQGGSARFTGLFSQHNQFGNVKVSAGNSSFHDSSILAALGPDGLEQLVGVHLASRFNHFDGAIWLSAYPFPFGTYTNGNNQSIGVMFSDAGYAGAATPDDNTVRCRMGGLNFQGGPNYKETAVWFKAGGDGNDIDIDTGIYFNQSNSRLLRINSGVAPGMKHNRITFRGTQLENAVADPTAYCRTVTVTSTGAAFPDVGENNAGVGATAWTNPGNVAANDAAEATCNAAASSQYLVVRDFDFAIPAGATIETVSITVEASEHSADTELLSFQLQDGSAALLGGVAGSFTLNATSPTTYTAGGTPADAWIINNTVITPAMVNDPDFGVRLWFSTAHDVRIDYVTMTVTYTNTDETAGIAGLDATNIVTIVDTDSGNGKFWDGDSWEPYTQP